MGRKGRKGHWQAKVDQDLARLSIRSLQKRISRASQQSCKEKGAATEKNDQSLNLYYIILPLSRR